MSVLTGVQVAEGSVHHNVGAFIRVHLGQYTIAGVETERERVAHPRLLFETSVGAVVYGNASKNRVVVTRHALVHLSIKLAYQLL